MAMIESTCTRCESPLEAGDLRCSICGLAVETAIARDALAVEILRCTGCGAAVRYDPAHRAPRCDFCGSVLELESVEDPVEQTEGYLPFGVDAASARRAMRAWLGSLGWFRPADLRSAARLESLKPLWWVGWIFDAEALVTWAADSEVGSGRSAWAPHSGECSMEFDDILVSASRGLTDAEVGAIAGGLDVTTALDQPSGADGATIEQFDVQRSQARRRVVEAAEAVARSRVSDEQVPGRKRRNVHVSVLLRRLATRRLSFPAWVLAYRYRNELYRAVICGQDAGRVTGTAPWSIARILLAVAGGLVVIGTIAAVVAASLR